MQKVTKAERQIKADKVVDLILKYIKDNNLQAGSRLPSERVLVEMFSVGRPAIREATRILSILASSRFASREGCLSQIRREDHDWIIFDCICNPDRSV